MKLSLEKIHSGCLFLHYAAAPVQFLILLLFIPVYAAAQDPSVLYSRANKAYSERKFEEAILKYEEIVKSGNVSAEVYFNLGNAYYKSGNIPSAILNYERARRLNPADADIEFNLRLAYLQTIDKIEPAPEVFYKKWWNAFVNKLTADEHAKRALLFMWIAFAVALVYLFVNHSLFKKITFLIAGMLLVASVFMIYLSAKQVHSLRNNRAGVIFSTNVYVKGSPDEKSTNLFMLHAGTRVDVMDELQGWKRIRIANGNEGWIDASAIEII